MSEQQAAPVNIKIDDVDYKIDDLSDNAKAQLQGIQVAEVEMKRLNMQLALAQTARNAYMHALQADLPEKGDDTSH